MLLAVLFTGLICTLAWSNEVLQASAAEPGYLDFDNLPETNFSCEGKVIGGYYADVETGCQMFHVCTIGQKGEVADIKFLCLNGTVFDQETRVCERLDEVDCSKSESYYDLNLELYGNSGATYGIQPENEEEPPASNDNDEDKCVDDEEDCKTEPQEPQEPQESPPPNKPADLEDEYEELEEIVDPTTSSTTSSTTSTTTTTTTTTTPRPSRPPLTYPTSPRPAQVPYPTSSPETIAALLALHNAFQESLKEHERPLPPRVSSSFTSPSPLPVRTPPPPPPPPRFSSPVSFSTSPRPLSFVQNSQNYNGGNHQSSLSQQPQVSNHHFPAPQTHRQPLPQPFPFNVSPKPKQPVPSFTSTIRTSQAFGNSNFQQTFREEQQQQQQKLQPQEEDEEYSVEDYDQTQASSPRPLYNAYKHNQNRFAISHQDTNPSPPPSNYLLHQLKLRFNDSPPQRHPGAHGFTRAVSNHDTKILSYPEKPPQALIASSTTPAAVSVILSKSSTSSVVRSVSSRNQSAISHVHHPPPFNASKYFTTSTIKPSSTTVANVSLPLEEEYKAEEEYDDYLEEELGPDPFYKDVQKLERQRRAVDSKWNETDKLNILRMKKEYVALMKMLEKKKYRDPDKQIIIMDKLLELRHKINLFEGFTPPSIVSSNPIPTETTTEEEDEVDNSTLLMLPPPTPPIRYPTPRIKHYEFSLLANDSLVLPFTRYTTSSLPNTRLPTPAPDRTTTKVTDFDIPEDHVTHPSLMRKLVYEDDFDSLSSSKNESIRELLLKLKSAALSSKKSSERGNDPTLWFSDKTDYASLFGDNFSEAICAGGNLYNDLAASNNVPDDAINTSSPVLLLGTRYVKLCRHTVSRGSLLVFLIETRFLLDSVQYRKLSAHLRKEQLVDIIELKSRIKVLLLQRKKNTFKVLRDFSTDENPRFIVEQILRKLDDSGRKDQVIDQEELAA